MQRSSDGTIKNAVKLHDGLTVESVLIPTANRTTACVSSQVGCSLDCKFCATSRLKRMRNLNPDEIVVKLMLKNTAQRDNAVLAGLAAEMLKAVQELLQILLTKKPLLQVMNFN